MVVTAPIPPVEFNRAYGSFVLSVVRVLGKVDHGHCLQVSMPFLTPPQSTLMSWIVYRYPIGHVPIAMGTFSTPGAASRYMLTVAQSTADRLSIRLQQPTNTPLIDDKTVNQIRSKGRSPRTRS